MTPEEKYELFEKYCSQELSINEKARLNKLIKEDAAAKKELKVYEELHSHLDVNFNAEKEREALKSNLKKIGDNFFSKRESKEKIKGNKKKEIKREVHEEIEKKSKLIKLPSWTYAAAASVAIIFGIYFFNQSSPVYADFASIPKLSITERGNAEEQIKNAENAFNSKNYFAAEKHLSTLLSKDENNTEYQFYYGISLLEQDKHAEATQVFERLYRGNSVYKYNALWFEALNQLKQKHFDQCSKLLKTIPKDSEVYKQSQKLLNKLK